MCTIVPRSSNQVFVDRLAVRSRVANFRANRGDAGGKQSVARDFFHLWARWSKACSNQLVPGRSPSRASRKESFDEFKFLYTRKLMEVVGVGWVGRESVCESPSSYSSIYGSSEESA